MMVDIHKIFEEYKSGQIPQKKEHHKEEIDSRISFENIIKKSELGISSIPSTSLSSTGTGEDNVSISEDAKKAYEILQIISKVNKIPDIREEKVTALKEQFAKGNTPQLSLEAREIIVGNIIKSFREKFG